MSTETELKLSLAADDIPRLLQHPLLANAPKRQKLYNTYFDTEDLALARQKIAVRERRVLRKTLLTVKTAQRSEGGISQRSEWEAPTHPGSFDFTTLVDEASLAEMLSQMVAQLRPIFFTNFSRRYWLLEFRGAHIEVALDQGSITTQRDGLTNEAPICELELELKAGRPETLFALARMLSRQLRLHPENESKAARGYNLFLGKTHTPVKAEPIRVESNDNTLVTFQRIAQSCLAHLQANERGILLPQDEEYIHQARVALRRLRTALRLFSDSLPTGFANRWSTAWRSIAQELGNARNWDVFCTEQLPLLDQDLGEHPDVVALRAFAQQQRQEAHTTARQHLSSKSYSLTLIGFCEALMTLKAPEEPMQNYATQALKKRHKHFLKGARLAHTLNAEQRHEVRIDLKKLRYTLDFFESLYPKKQVQAFTQALAETQELLGHMNDLVTAELLMSTRTLPMADTPIAWAKGRMSAYLALLPTYLKPVIKAKTPW